MSIMEKLGRAAGELENAADEAFDKAKEKYNEKVTPEKRQEIQDKFDSGVKFVEEAADKLRTCWQQKNSLVVTAE